MKCGYCKHFKVCQEHTADGFEDTFDTPSGQIQYEDPACEHFEEDVASSESTPNV